MREFEGYENLDEYEDNNDDGEAQEVGYEEEEDPKLSQEQLEYLELRQKLKELYRKRLQKETGSDANSVDRSRKDNFGSFFGPSQPVIAQRVIQESKSLLENQHLVSRIFNPGQTNKKIVNQCSVGSRPQSHNMPKADSIKVKVQKLKDTRDYSFLLNEDAQPPAPRREPPLREVSAPNPWQPLSSGSRPVLNSCRQVHSGRDERKPISTGGKHQQANPQDLRAASIIRHNKALSDPRKQHVSSGRHGIDQPVDSKGQLAIRSGTGSESSVAKMANSSLKKPGSAPITKSCMSGSQRPIPPPRTNLQTGKQPMTQKKVLHDAYKPEMNVKHRDPSATAQTNGQMSKLSSKLAKPVSSQSYAKDRLIKRPPSRLSDEEDDCGFDYRSEIRNLFRYDPTKFQDDDDTSDMEANFDEILKEERRSALIARKEDEIQQKLIEEEERIERMRKQAKKQKLGQR